MSKNISKILRITTGRKTVNNQIGGKARVFKNNTYFPFYSGDIIIDNGTTSNIIIDNGTTSNIIIDNGSQN